MLTTTTPTTTTTLFVTTSNMNPALIRAMTMMAAVAAVSMA
jgi:hypothetical protein